MADDALIPFPCDFPIKVMGAKVEGFAETMAEVARGFDPGFSAERMERRDSSAGKYLGLTLHVHVNSRAQLDDLYRALSGHPMVKVVL